jgi:DNA polymerase-3 subunit delta'
VGALDRWAQAWETLQRLPREVEALNLDRTDALFAALTELRRAARA